MDRESIKRLRRLKTEFIYVSQQIEELSSRGIKNHRVTSWKHYFSVFPETVSLNDCKGELCYYIALRDKISQRINQASSS